MIHFQIEFTFTRMHGSASFLPIFFFTFMFFINYGLKCLDEQLKINNTVDTRIQIKQSAAQQ